MQNSLERYYPYMLAVIGPITYVLILQRYGYFADPPILVPLNFFDTIEELMFQFATISGTLAGFSYTVKTILFALPDRPIVKRLKEMHTFPKLVSYATTSINHWLIVLSISIAYIAGEFAMSDSFKIIMFGIVIYFIVLAIVSFHRATSLITKLSKVAVSS